MIDMEELTWRTSTYTNGAGECVEVAELRGGGQLVRDTKDQGRGPILCFTDAEWREFVLAVKDGKFG